MHICAEMGNAACSSQCGDCRSNAVYEKVIYATGLQQDEFYSCGQAQVLTNSVSTCAPPDCQPPLGNHPATEEGDAAAAIANDVPQRDVDPFRGNMKTRAPLADDGQGPTSVSDGDSQCDTSVISGLSAITSPQGTSRSQAQAHQVVKGFVRSIVRGMTISVLVHTGGTMDCFVQLDRKLTTMSLQRSGKKESKKREVRLEQIQQIAIGDDVCEEVELDVDDFCVTLFFDDGQAIGLRFENFEERDTFALCLSMFVDGRRAEIEKKVKGTQSSK